MEKRRIHLRYWVLGLALAVGALPAIAASGEGTPDAQDLRRDRPQLDNRSNGAQGSAYRPLSSRNRSRAPRAATAGWGASAHPRPASSGAGEPGSCEANGRGERTDTVRNYR